MKKLDVDTHTPETTVLHLALSALIAMAQATFPTYAVSVILRDESKEHPVTT